MYDAGRTKLCCRCCSDGSGWAVVLKLPTGTPILPPPSSSCRIPSVFLGDTVVRFCLDRTILLSGIDPRNRIGYCDVSTRHTSRTGTGTATGGGPRRTSAYPPLNIIAAHGEVDLLAASQQLLFGGPLATRTDATAGCHCGRRRRNRASCRPESVSTSLEIRITPFTSSMSNTPKSSEPSSEENRPCSCLRMAW